MARIEDVAKMARVSSATVSAVINHQNTVEAKTKRRVLAAIKKLNYQPNLYASNLARRHTRLLGLVLSDIVNPFFAEIAQRVQREALARGYEVSLAATQFSREDLAAAVRRLIGMRVAGLAIMTTEMNAQVLDIIRSHRVPAIFEDVGTVSDTVSNIRIDYEGGIYKAVKYLVDLGHKQILFVRSYPDTSQKASDFLSICLRTQAFEGAIAQFQAEGVKAEVVTFPGEGPKAGLRAIQEALGRCSFTAAIAIADPVALGVLGGLHRWGLVVPRDVSLIGFDNSYLCEYLTPPLTSVNIPRDRLASMVVECLIRNVEQKEAGRTLQLETELIIRDSVAPPRSGWLRPEAGQEAAKERTATTSKSTPPRSQA